MVNVNSLLKAAGNLAALLLLIAATAYVAFGAGRKVGRVERLFDRPKVIRDETRAEPPPPLEAIADHDHELQSLQEASEDSRLANSKGW